MSLRGWMLRKVRNAFGVQAVIDAILRCLDDRLSKAVDRGVAQGGELVEAVRADVLGAIHGNMQEQFTALRGDLADAPRRCEERCEVLSAELTARNVDLQRIVQQECGEARLLLASMHSKCEGLAERESASLDVKTLVALRGSEMRFCLSNEGSPTISVKRGTASMPIAVCSIPKAGTYLIGQLLRLLGQEDLHLHVWNEGLSDYRDKTIEQMRRDYAQFTVQIPLRTSARLVQAGQFVVGHIQYSEESVAALSQFAMLIAVRDLRDAVVSHMRFFADTGRGGPETPTWSGLPDRSEKMLRYMSHVGPSYFALCRAVVPWLAHPDVLHVKFETLMGDHGPAAQVDLLARVCQRIGISPDAFDLAEVCGKALGSATKTWSGQRSAWSHYWNDAVEQRFQELGGDEMNCALGYGKAGCSE